MNKLYKIYVQFIPLLLTGISLFALCLLAFLTFKTPIPVLNFSLRKQLIITIYVTICLLGILATVSPCRRLLTSNLWKNRNIGHSKEKSSLTGGANHTLKGHHPTCGKFSSHILKIKGETYCSGCTGMAIGAVISLIGAIIYQFSELKAGLMLSAIFWFGFIMVIFGLIRYRLSNLKSGRLHFFLNVLLVLGTSLLLIGIDAINNNLILDFYLLILIFYWIVARIILSQLEHRKICERCGLRSCSYPRK